MRRQLLAGSAALLTASVVAGCAGAGTLGQGSGDKTTIVVAIVSNPQMEDAVSLSDEFEADNPDINLDFISLPENEARAKITASVATGGGEFDVVMISNYETPQWAENGWLVNLQPYADETEGYDPDDIIPSIRESLSYKGDLYSVPFYGESSFLVYRKDLFEEAGLTMPAKPTWQEVADFAAELDDPDNGMTGICLRGLAGWGENLAPLNTVVNTFGGRWFDEDWDAQLTGARVRGGGQLLRRPRAGLRRARRRDQRVLRVRHALQPGPGRHVVRRHLDGEHDRVRGGQHGRRQERIRTRTRRQDRCVRLALQLGSGHPGVVRHAGRGLAVHLLDDRQGLHPAGRRGARLGAGATRQPAVDLPDPGVRASRPRRTRSPRWPR